MTAWHAFTRGHEIQTLGWTLINFLWQGTLIALVLKCTLTALRHHRANLRYWTAAVTLVLLTAVPLLTFCMPHTAPVPTPSHVVSGQTTIEASPALPVVSVVAGPESSVQRAPAPSKPDSAMLRLGRWVHEFQAQLPDVLPSLMAAFWILGVVVTGIRALGGMIHANLLKKDSREFDPDGSMRFFILRSGAAGRVRLLESPRISVPTMIGWLHPAVIFPAGADIESSHLQALLAHELEHVRRRDYLVNLLQAAVEALLFFHPAVWWVSAQMRTERECCCDDAAVKACGDLRLYLSALSDAERRRSGSKLAVALSGASLLHRIRRLTEMKTFESNPWKTWSTAVSASAVLVIFSAASTLLAFVPVQAEPVPGQTTPREVNAKMPKPKSVVSSRQVSEKASAPISQPSTVTTSEVQKPPGAELERLKTQPADLSARYNSSHPDVMALESMAAGKERDSAAGNPQQAKITGTVLDPTGGVIPGATILILAGQTGELLGTTVSGANGSFEIVPPSGNYYIQFAAPGFQTQVFYNPQLGASPLMVAMELGVVREMVTVMTAAPATASTRVSREPVKVEPLRVGGNVVPPRLVQRADPVYPPEARDANVEGPVVVSALIDAEGNVIAPVVLSGHLLLRNAAVACVQQWHYDPALLDAEPRPVRLSITIIFKLQR